MAKRKRLTPANPMFLDDGAPPAPVVGRAPIAGVAGDASALAALEEVSESLARARADGRMIVALPLDQVQFDYLVRDRLSADSEEMAVLMASLQARGQQTPVEVVALGGDRYGLISGWRRCQALRRLAETEAGDGTVLAVLRRPAEASDAYLAMVEENEIRVGLSYFERAHIALKTVEQGVFETERDALRALFGTASRAKRSKIGSFVTVVRALNGYLRFPETIGERLGLALAQRLDKAPGLAADLRGRLKEASPVTIEAEQALLSQALSAAKPAPPHAAAKSGAHEILPGLWLRTHEADGRVELWGKRLTVEARHQLMIWLKMNFTTN